MFTTAGIALLLAETHARYDMVLEHADKLPGGAFLQPVPNFGRSTVRDQVVHMLATEAAWVCALQGEAMPDFRYEDYENVTAVRALRRQVKAATDQYLESLPEAQLSEVLSPLPKDWVGAPATPAFILHHIITHYFHHKGQVASMFRILGHPIGDTDLQRE